MAGWPLHRPMRCSYRTERINQPRGLDSEGPSPLQTTAPPYTPIVLLELACFSTHFDANTMAGRAKSLLQLTTLGFRPGMGVNCRMPRPPPGDEEIAGTCPMSSLRMAGRHSRLAKPWQKYDGMFGMHKRHIHHGRYRHELLANDVHPEASQVTPIRPRSPKDFRSVQ